MNIKFKFTQETNIYIESASVALARQDNLSNSSRIVILY